MYNFFWNKIHFAEIIFKKKFGSLQMSLKSASKMLKISMYNVDIQYDKKSSVLFLFFRCHLSETKIYTFFSPEKQVDLQKRPKNQFHFGSKIGKVPKKSIAHSLILPSKIKVFKHRKTRAEITGKTGRVFPIE
jgi:hypothetical protein